jgi:non-heme chloroperoxidase
MALRLEMLVERVIERGETRAPKLVFLAAVTPFLLKTPTNPDGAPIEVFDGVRAAIQADRSQWNKDASMPYYNYNRDGAKVVRGGARRILAARMTTAILAAYWTIGAFSETDFREDLKKITVSTMVLHGGDDKITHRNFR